MGDSNAVAVRVAKEASFGVVPTTGWEDLRMQDEDLATSATYTSSEERRTDGNVTDSLLTDSEGGGGINAQWTAETWDLLIAGILRSSWEAPIAAVASIGANQTVPGFEADFSGFSVGSYMHTAGFPDSVLANNGVWRITRSGDAQDVQVEDRGEIVTHAADPTQSAEMGRRIVNGVEDQSFSIEREFTDMTSQTPFALHSGQIPTTWEFTAPVSGPLTTRFTFTGNPEITTFARASTGQPQAANTNPVQVAAHAMKTFALTLPDGSEMSACLVEYSHTVTQTVTLNKCQGSTAARDYSMDRTVVTGAFQLYFNDDPESVALFQAFEKSQIVQNFHVAYIDETNKGYAFVFENVRLTAGSRPSTTTGPVFMNFTFQSIFRSGLGSMEVHAFDAA